MRPALQAWRIATALLAACALDGCVMFEHPPAPLACDPALVGRWIPLPDSPQDRVPLGKDDYADVDAACRVRLRDGARAEAPEFDALGFELDGERYLALGFKELEGLFGTGKAAAPPIPKGMPAGAVTLLKYRIRDDTLQIAMLDTVDIMQRVQQGTLKAREADASTYLFEGRPDHLRQLLEAEPALFDAFDGRDKTLRMRRAKDGKRS
ncbi:hypothetical protein ASD77_13305 [Pseudoxanthomonas sp. Root65]|uniref:hypothetical protein n=1 Tax=Pseudoxanthomonas sp. Root65 TaxID=1736576 RepID=UPI0006FF0D79|nr:hypothetical protein [Pseudoxanthomonas sp. Root65]KRA52609.1 hypothetical protein ASD77_13305 [Pseudoxanthomonas sp. Root65]